jgi:signal transduction histidine kinase
MVASRAGSADPVWLRFANWLIPERLRGDPDTYRRARTAVYSCLVPLPMSLVFAWSYERTPMPDVAHWASGAVLGTNLAAALALYTLRRSGSVVRTANILLSYSFCEFALLAYLFGGAVSSSIYWSMLLPLVAMLLAGPRSALVWLGLCFAEYLLVYVLKLDGVELVNHLPAERRALLWFSSLSCISLLCLTFVLIYERAKDGTLRSLRVAHGQLERARDVAEAANRSKSDFLAKVSAEIRAPMTAILGAAARLWRESAELGIPAEYAASLRTIERNGEHLLELINDILDLSKISTGSIDVVREALSPIELVSDVVSLMSVRAEAKNLVLAIEYRTPMPQTIQGDARRLKQVLVNLVGNALKFTDEGAVTLHLALLEEQAEPALRFEVWDTGIGLSDDEIARLFQPFAQADASTARKYGGSGLGLSICKSLVERMGGEIAVESRAGVGSVFRVTLPTGPLDGVPRIADPEQIESLVRVRRSVSRGRAAE